jgi:hypothetical protein
MRTEPSAELASRCRSRQNVAIVVLRQVLSAYESGRQCRARRREHFVAVLLSSAPSATAGDDSIGNRRRSAQRLGHFVWSSARYRGVELGRLALGRFAGASGLPLAPGGRDNLTHLELAGTRTDAQMHPAESLGIVHDIGLGDVGRHSQDDVALRQHVADTYASLICLTKCHDCCPRRRILAPTDQRGARFDQILFDHLQRKCEAARARLGPQCVGRS